MPMNTLERADGLPETREQYRARLTAEVRSLGALVRDAQVRLTRPVRAGHRRILEHRRDVLGARLVIVQAALRSAGPA